MSLVGFGLQKVKERNALISLCDLLTFIPMVPISIHFPYTPLQKRHQSTNKSTQQTQHDQIKQCSSFYLTEMIDELPVERAQDTSHTMDQTRNQSHQQSSQIHYIPKRYIHARIQRGAGGPDPLTNHKY